jgi:hypothetical protein
MVPEKIFVGYDSRCASAIFAAATMNEAIKLAIRYMNTEDFTVESFSYDEDNTVIEYSDSFRIGNEIIKEGGTITLTPAKFYKSE